MPASEPTRVLKANAVRELGAKVVFNYEDIRRRCEEYVEQAQQQAAQIIKQAQEEAQALKHSSFHEANKQGLENGLRNAAEEIESRARLLADERLGEKLATALPAISQVAESVARERERWLADWEAAAIRLCAAIAGKIIRHELTVNHECIRTILAETLQLAAGNASIQVHLHPDDVAAFGPHGNQIIGTLARCADATIVPDEQITRGGCYIETQYGTIDGRIETQLSRITSELLQADHSQSAPA